LLRGWSTQICRGWPSSGNSRARTADHSGRKRTARLCLWNSGFIARAVCCLVAIRGPVLKASTISKLVAMRLWHISAVARRTQRWRLENKPRDTRRQLVCGRWARCPAPVSTCCWNGCHRLLALAVETGRRLRDAATAVGRRSPGRLGPGPRTQQTWNRGQTCDVSASFPSGEPRWRTSSRARLRVFVTRSSAGGGLRQFITQSWD